MTPRADTARTPIRRRPDGSIDDDFHLAEGNRRRAEAAAALLRLAGRTLDRLRTPAGAPAAAPGAGGQSGWR